MKTKIKPRLFNFVGAILLLALLFLVNCLVNSKKALAYSTSTPIQQSAPATNSANVFPGGGDTQPWFVVGRGAFGGPDSYAKVYVPNNTSANLTIVNGAGYGCTGAGGKNLDIWGGGGVPMVGYQLTALNQNESGTGAWQIVDSNLNHGNSCNSFTWTIPANVGAPSKVQGHTRYRVFYFEATMANPCNTPNLCDTVKSFRLSITNTSISANQPYVGLSRKEAISGYSVDETTVFGVGMLDAQGKGQSNWSFAAQFAPRCNETNFSNPLSIFDIDYGVYDRTIYPDYGIQDTNLTARLSGDNRTDAAYNWALIQQRSGGGGGATGWGGSFGVNHSVYNMGPNFDLAHRNLIELKALSYRNLVQLRLPFDQFDSLGSVGSACNSGPDAACTVDSTGNTSSTKTVNLAAGATWQDGVTFTNTGSTDWVSPPYQWQTVTSSPNSPHNLPNTVIPLDSFDTGNFTFTAGGYNSVKTITFQMLISGQKPQFGETCTLILRVGPPPNASSIDARCEYTTLTVNDATPSANPVPVSVIITNAANAADTHTYNDTILLNASHIGQKIIPTFDMWNPGMWPHNSYNYQFMVDGVPVAAPAGVDSTSTCLKVTCGGGTQVDGQPGENASVSYQFTATNDGGRMSGGPSGNGDFGDTNSGDYNFSGVVTPGVVLVSGDPQSTSGPIVSWKTGNANDTPVTSNINVSLTIQAKYTGTYTVVFRFGNTNLVSCPPVTITPATQSYFKVTNGDIATGGGFRDPADVCPTTAPGYISPGTGYDTSQVPYDYAGGIRAYANPSYPGGGLGASVDFGAEALGLIIGHSAGDIGFYSKHNELASNSGYPPGSEPGYGSLGGYLTQTGASDAHCVRDYFTITRFKGQNPTNIGPSVNAATLADGQYQYVGPTLTIDMGSSPNLSGQERVTIYVDGDVIIDGDIKYPAKWNALSGNRSHIPYFTVIARGNITLTKDVTQLDGLYIAQPTVPGYTKGVFSTCYTFCAKGLVVNGAVIAQSIQLTRAHGTVGPCDDGSCGTVGNGAAEQFNYAPFIVLGLPEFDPGYNSTEDLFSLPPVF